MNVKVVSGILYVDSHLHVSDGGATKVAFRPGKKNISFSGPPASLFGCWAFFFFN